MPRTALIHPAVWTGAELSGRGEWNHILDPHEQADLRAIADAVSGAVAEPREPGRQSPDDFPLPRLTRRLEQIRTELEDGAGAVRLRGLPLDGLSDDQCRAVSWAIAVHLGTPVSQSGAGEKIFSIRDAGFGNDDPRSRGPNTSRELSFHTDRADVTAFTCLQPASRGGDNEIVSSMAVYNAILQQRPEYVEALTAPFYYLRHNVDAGNDRPWCRQPVFSFAEDHFACCLLRVLIERAHQDSRLPDLTPTQVRALDMVESVARERGRSLRFRQERGDMVLVNNWVILHKRTAFEDVEDSPLQRHILRIWLAMPNSRPLDPVFRDNWGAVEAGAVRGGMRATVTT